MMNLKTNPIARSKIGEAQRAKFRADLANPLFLQPLEISGFAAKMNGERFPEKPSVGLGGDLLVHPNLGGNPFLQRGDLKRVQFSRESTNGKEGIDQLCLKL